MIDVRLVRTDFDAVRAALARRGDPSILESLERVAALDVRLREIIADRDSLRARVKSLSKDVGGLRRDGRTEEAEAVQAESRALGEQAAALDAEYDEVNEQVRGELLVIPNLPFEGSPDGASDADNPIVKGPFLPDSFP